MKSNLDYSHASRDAAVATYQKAIQTAFREVADALAQRGTINERIADQTTRTNSARAAAMLSDARYRAGVESLLTILMSSVRGLPAAARDDAVQPKRQFDRALPLARRRTELTYDGDW